jgi:ketosteroid isomerase-like protein
VGSTPARSGWRRRVASSPAGRRLDVDQTYVSGDLAILVAVERQHGTVGGSEDQDWSLRVTLVLRRVGGRWHLVHRHADPLVHPIPWRHLAELARGLEG